MDVNGIDELSANAITVYPNPTSGSIKIDFEGNIDGSNLAAGKYTASVISVMQFTDKI